MVTPVEIGIVVLAFIALIIAYHILKAIKTLILNAIMGVVILLVANWAGAGVAISIWAIIVCAIAGIPGAILVILLSYLDIAFVNALVW